FSADARGEMFSWFDSLLESRYFGFTGTDVTRNIYIADSNSSDINVSNEWLITNGTTIDSLREVVRYMPNFIATVVPYEQDATLFIGDPANIYQYRKPNKIEQKYEVKFNNSIATMRNQNIYAAKNNDINRIIDTINKKNMEFAEKIDIDNMLWRERGQEEHITPQELKDTIDNILLEETQIDGIKEEVLAKLFCNYFRILYDSSKKKTYLQHLSAILSVKLKEVTFHGSIANPTAPAPNYNFYHSVDSILFFNQIPLNSYRTFIGTFSDERMKYLPSEEPSVNAEEKTKQLSTQDRLRKFLLKQEKTTNTVVLQDSVFNLGLLGSRGYSYLYNLYETKIAFNMSLLFLNQIISEHKDYIENEAAKLAKTANTYESLNILPWNYKVFRDHHVLSSEHDLIANNLTASESDMWSAVALRVPMDTVETINGFTWQAFQWGIEEGGADSNAGTYRIDSDQTFGIYPNKLGGGVNFRGYHPGPRDIIENFTEINATTPSLAQNALKFRLAQGLSKMYRGNLITIGRNIKPYDQIQVVDNVNNMYGKVMAERVIHHFSATTGWTTTIVPCALTRVNSKQASYNVSESDKWLYTLSQGKLGRYLMNAMTLVTFGSAGLGLKGGMYFLGRLPFGFMKRVLSGTFGGNSIGLWSAAKYPYNLAKLIANKQNTTVAYRVAARFGWNPLKGGGSGMLITSGLVQGGAGVGYQFNNMSISQSIALKEGETVHQPCHVSLMTYNGSPFLAGLEDPISSMTNNNAWAELSTEFEYAWREWTSRPNQGKVQNTNINSFKGITNG
ncbi:hypothetical protein N8457_00540, partial [bacterium]|nr:hypothetical protein [bacterium]